MKNINNRINRKTLDFDSKCETIYILALENDMKMYTLLNFKFFHCNLIPHSDWKQNQIKNDLNGTKNKWFGLLIK